MFNGILNVWKLLCSVMGTQRLPKHNLSPYPPKLTVKWPGKRMVAVRWNNNNGLHLLRPGHMPGTRLRTNIPPLLSSLQHP